MSTTNGFAGAAPASETEDAIILWTLPLGRVLLLVLGPALVLFLELQTPHPQQIDLVAQYPG